MISNFVKLAVVTNLFITSDAIAEERLQQASANAAQVDPLSMSNILQMAAGLAFVVLLIFLLGWFYRRFGSPKTLHNGDFRIVAGLSMGQRERVVMLEVGKKQILLGVGPGHVEKIHVFDEPVIKTSDTGIADSFAERLTSVIKQRAQQ